MLLTFPTTGDGYFAVSIAHIQQVYPYGADATRLVFTGDGLGGISQQAYTRLSFDDTVRRINDAMTAGV